MNGINEYDSTASAGADMRTVPSSGEKPYWNPYIAGVGLGLTLLATFVIMGRGLGASGGFTSIVAFCVNAVTPDHAQSNGLFYSYLESSGHHPLMEWLVFEILGIAAGGFVSGRLAGRTRLSVAKGPGISAGARLVLAFSGGLAMGFAAKMARGCTSGQALTGGALLSVGSWVFMISMFIGAFLFARVVRRQWT